jgi:enterobacterial common antigen flippase
MSSGTVVVPVEGQGLEAPEVRTPSAAAPRVLRSTLLMGGASVVAMATGIIRVKVFAVLLGPAGIGIYGTLQSIQSLAISLADLGLTGAGAREIASARHQGRAVNDVQYVLTRLALLFGSVVGVAVWLLRNPLSNLAFGTDRYAALVGVLGLGVLAAVIGGVASALLMGNHRVGALARARSLASVAAAIAGVLCVYFFREAGLSWALISIPVFTFLFAWMATRPLVVAPSAVRAFWERPEVRSILTFGGAAFGASVVGMAVEVGARAFLVRYHGLEAAGEYQAAWSISMLYCGIVLAAIPADFFPRASTLTGDRIALGKAAVAQTRTVMALIATPVLLVLLFAPLVIQLVFTRDFTRAAEVLQWQVIGDPLRVVWWILATTILAAGAVRKFVIVQVYWNAWYLAGVMVLPGYMGLGGAGLALPLSFAAALPLLLWFASSVIPWTAVVQMMKFPGVVVAVAAIMGLASHFGWGGAYGTWAIGAAGILYVGILSLRGLTERGGA